MELRTERLVISEIDKGSADKITERVEERHVSELFEQMPQDRLKEPSSIERVVLHIAKVCKAQNADYFGAWCDSELIGYAAIVECDDDAPEIQIEILPEFQHQGFGYEFLSALLSFLFNEQAYEKFRYSVLPNNIPSIGLAEKLGGMLKKPESLAEEYL